MASQPLVKKPVPVPAMLADTDGLFKQARLGSDTFRHAVPFPAVLLRGMIKPLCCPALYQGLRMWPAVSGYYPQGDLPSVVHLLLWELSSSTLIRHFASFAGTPPLLPDPFLLGGGPRLWTVECLELESSREGHARHPQTDLQNCLRLEIFVAENVTDTFNIEFLDSNNKVVSSEEVGSGTALLVESNNYHLRYRCSQPGRWASLLSYYYINDRARESHGEGADHDY